jgi:hypothetical protein
MAIHDDSPFKNRRHILTQSYLHQPIPEAERLVQNLVMSSPQENTTIGSTKIRDGFNQGGFTIQKCATCVPNDSVTNLGLAIGCNLSLSMQTEPRDPGFGFTRDKLCQF